MKIFRLIVLCLSIFLLAISTLSGMLMNYLFVFLLISTLAMTVTVIVSIIKKQICWGFSDKDFKLGIYAPRVFLRNAAWVIIGVCVYIAVIPIQFSSSVFASLTVMIWGLVITLCLLDWVPRKKVSKSLNVTLFLFLSFLTFQLIMIYWPISSTNNIELRPPVKGDWYVFQGGNSALLNHHHFFGSQKYAMDIIVPEDGVLPLEKIADLRQYKTFGQPLYAPIDGEVVALVDSLPDQKIGETDLKNLTGNHVVIKTATDIFILMGHLQNGSVLVTEGDKVKIGQEIAKIGNSGNTSQPHLHIQAMTNMDFMNTESKSVPMSFKIGDERPVFYKRNDILSGL